MTPRVEASLVAIACLVAYLGGLGDIAFYTRGEPREGLVVREMLRTGEWVVPARPEAEIARKPPLYYWLAAPSLAAQPGAPEWALRLPSAVVATAATLGTWALARTVAGPAAGLPAALVLATAFEWTRSATAARVDMTLAAALTAVLAGWMLVLAGGSRRWIALAAAGAALATLAKGPVGIVLPVLAAGGFATATRDRGAIRRLGVVPVVATAALVAGAWYATAFLEQGRAFLDVVFKENLVRFIDTDDARTGHAHGLAYLPVLGLVGLLPWVPLLPLARIGRSRSDAPAAWFAAIWAGAVLVFFSLANAKRSVYLLPAFPALAVLVGAGAARGDDGLARRLAVLYVPALLLLATIGAALAIGYDPGVVLRPWLRPDDAHGATAVAGAVRAARASVALLAAATVAGAVAIERARRANAWRTLVGVAAALAVAWTVLFDVVVHPSIGRTRSLAAFMEDVDRTVPKDAVLEASFPTDPGLRFYAPRLLGRFQPDGGDAPRYVLFWEDEWRRWRDPAGASLAPLLVSEARQAHRGHLTLVVAPAEPLHPVAPAPAAPARDRSGRTPGLRAPGLRAPGSDVRRDSRSP